MTIWSMRLLSLVASVAALLVTVSASAQQPSSNALSSPEEQRIALVIGNAEYKVAPLRNSSHDAEDIAKALREKGFKVTLRLNANQKQMKQAIRDFGSELKKGGVGLFYYAGHGVQSRGRNYLVPVGSTIGSEAELEDESVDANLVLSFMDEAQNRVNVVILDACRDNPFARSFRSASRGLAQMDAAKGTFIAFSTAPGSVASDGAGRNGLYTKHLLASLQEPDTSIEQTFKRVRREVARESGNKQIPWESSSLIGDFSFGRRNLQVAVVAPASAAVPNLNLENSIWAAANNSRNATLLRNYLEKYPNGKYFDAARMQLGNGNWILDSKGCKVWRSDPVPKESVEWSGECTNGIGNGIGTLVFQSGGVRAIFEDVTLDMGWITGKFRLKRFDGEALMNMVEGILSYSVDGRPITTRIKHTFGTDVPTLISFEGTWNGERPERGVLKLRNGMVYSGPFNKDVAYEGFGKLTYTNGTIYEGEFVNGEATGKGTLTWTDGSKYVGEFLSGKPHGRGVTIDSNGKRSEGEFVAGNRLR